jgi:hypothetical protein
MKSRYEDEMKPAMSPLVCFAHGNGRGWEAICVDFDIAVQGTSFDEVKASLDRAIDQYVSAASAEDAAVCRKLLSRRAPFHVRAMLTIKLISFNLFRGRMNEAQASFPVSCPA